MKCPYCNNEIPENSNSCPICGVNIEMTNTMKRTTSNSIGTSILYIIIGLACVFIFRESHKEYVINNIPYYFGFGFALIGCSSLLGNINDKISKKGSVVLLIIYNIVSILSMLVWPSVFGYIALTHLDDATVVGFSSIMVVLGLIAVGYNISKSIEIRKK